MEIQATIRGLAPLLQNRFPEEEESENKSKKRQKVYIAKEEAEKKLYKNESGKVCQLARHIEASMMKAAVNFKFEGRKSFKEPFKGGVFVSPEKIPHKFPKWEIDRQPVVIQRARIMRSRPRFDKWELDFNIEVIDDRIPANVIKEVLVYAGLYKGIGDNRPRYGRFEVKKFKIIKK